MRELGLGVHEEHSGEAIAVEGQVVLQLEVELLHQGEVLGPVDDADRGDHWLVIEGLGEQPPQALAGPEGIGVGSAVGQDEEAAPGLQRRRTTHARKPSRSRSTGSGSTPDASAAGVVMSTSGSTWAGGAPCVGRVGPRADEEGTAQGPGPSQGRPRGLEPEPHQELHGGEDLRTPVCGVRLDPTRALASGRYSCTSLKSTSPMPGGRPSSCLVASERCTPLSLLAKASSQGPCPGALRYARVQVSWWPVPVPTSSRSRSSRTHCIAS